MISDNLSFALINAYGLIFHFTSILICWNSNSGWPTITMISNGSNSTIDPSFRISNHASLQISDYSLSRGSFFFNDNSKISTRFVRFILKTSSHWDIIHNYIPSPNLYIPGDFTEPLTSINKFSEKSFSWKTPNYQMVPVKYFDLRRHQYSFCDGYSDNLYILLISCFDLKIYAF